MGVGQIRDQQLAQFMDDSCELLHKNAQYHKTKRQKCGYINFRNVYRVPGKKVPGAIKGQLLLSRI